MSNMAVQMNYGEPSRGMPGGLYDRAEYEAVTRRNSAEDKALCFGYGVVQGAEPGKDIALPATDVTADKFEGVVMYSANVEMDDDGAVLLRKNQIVDVCQSGKLWVQLVDSVEPAFPLRHLLQERQGTRSISSLPMDCNLLRSVTGILFPS